MWLEKRNFCGYNAGMRTGRPKLPDDERKENVLRIRLSDGERQAIDAVAASQDQETSTWARDVLLALAKKGRKKGSA